MSSRYLCRFCPRSYKRRVFRDRHTAAEHSELLHAFLKHIDDATDPRTVITFSEQSDEVANPHVSEDEDQPHLQRSTPGAACRVEVFPNAGSFKGPSSSFEEYAGYSFENPWVPFADAEEFKLI